LDFSNCTYARIRTFYDSNFTEGWPEAGLIDLYWSTLYTVFIGGVSSAAADTWSQRAASLLFWAMAISVTGTIIGFITSLIQSRIASLKKGKSPIIEGNHTLILGWSLSMSANTDLLPGNSYHSISTNPSGHPRGIISNFI